MLSGKEVWVWKQSTSILETGELGVLENLEKPRSSGLVQPGAGTGAMLCRPHNHPRGWDFYPKGMRATVGVQAVDRDEGSSSLVPPAPLAELILSLNVRSPMLEMFSGPHLLIFYP